MDFQNIEISHFAVNKFIFYAIVIFIIFRLTHIGLPFFLRKKGQKKLSNRFLSGIELFVWLLFLVWALQFFTTKHPLYTIGIFIIFIFLILLIAWLVIKDFIAGAFFKISGRFSINDYITFRGFTGKIVRFRNRTFEMETEIGEIICVPYSLAISEIVIRTHPSEAIVSSTFRMKISKPISLISAINEIKRAILQLPWASVNKDPVIKPVDEDQDNHILEITIYSIEREYFYKIENYIKKHFQPK